MKKVIALTLVLIFSGALFASHDEPPKVLQVKKTVGQVESSGTAITLADEIVENIDRKEAWAEDTTDKKLLRVDHIRRGEVPGIHTIRYDSEADIITITHDAHSRQGFALGAVLAAEYTKDHQGLLTISDMFKF